MTNEQEILEKTHIEVEIGKYVQLNKRGVNFIGICPFHSEKTPSFTVSPSKKIYKCFGCGKSGNVFSFIQNYKKVSFENAVQIVHNSLDTNLELDEDLIKTDIFLENSIEIKVFNSIRDNFYSNIKSVKDLMNFDKNILDFCIYHIEILEKKIKNNNEIKITNVAFLPENTLIQLRQIKENNSLRDMYTSIFNQSLVLLVSYFTSAIKELFGSTIQYLAENNQEHFSLIKSDIKFSFQELGNYNFNLTSEIGNLIIEKNNISFQDMQSICREFKQYFGFEIEKNIDLDNIILSQASRHSIVHALSIADSKFMNQIRNTDNRTIKTHVELNDPLLYSPEEIEAIIESMNNFFNMLFNKLKNDCH